MSRKEILWDYSWQNIVMLLASIPKYEDKENTKELPENARELDDINEVMEAFG